MKFTTSIGCKGNVNTEIISFIPKYVKRQQIELVELSFFAIFCGFGKQDELVNNN